nr:hypothetical protein [Chitinivorax tropicus]
MPDTPPNPNALASDYAVKAARQALSQARTLPSEIDLIISLSISPSRVATAANIAGPRLSHPIQRDLRASHAVVFDLLDADWSFALDIAQSYCRQLGYRRALVVRAECLADVAQVAGSGFSDGAGAIVLTSGRRPHRAAYGELGIPPLVSAPALSVAQIHDTGCYARLDSCYDAQAQRFAAHPAQVGRVFETIIESVLSSQDGPVDRLFCESWLSPWLPHQTWAHRADHIMIEHASTDVPMLFQFPAWLADRLRQSGRSSGTNQLALTLDVFKSRVGCFVME